MLTLPGGGGGGDRVQAVCASQWDACLAHNMHHTGCGSGQAAIGSLPRVASTHLLPLHRKSLFCGSRARRRREEAREQRYTILIYSCIFLYILGASVNLPLCVYLYV